MKVSLNFVLFVTLSIGTVVFASAQGSGLNGANGPSLNTNVEPKTGITTLAALDPLTQSVCFKDGGPGGVFQNGQTRNRCSDLNFNSYYANSFAVGVEGGREGVIVDLGTSKDLMTRYGFTETVGNGQGFASIDIQNGKAMVLENYETGALQELKEAGALFQSPVKSAASAPVKLGHIYLLRVTDRHDKAFEMFAKILVIAHVPNESVTLRWVLLTNKSTAKL